MLSARWTLALAILYFHLCSAEIPGGDTVKLIATSYEYHLSIMHHTMNFLLMLYHIYPLIYELERSPRAIVEVEISVPEPPLSCFSQDHNATNPMLILFVEEESSMWVTLLLQYCFLIL